MSRRTDSVPWALYAGALYAAVLWGCGEPLPARFEDYAKNCVQMNVDPLPQRSDDPHEGEKNVYACDVPSDILQANERPFPVGSVIVKESTRKDADFPWLVATAEKGKEGWRWNEYSRNFRDEEFLEILPSEDVCIDCHKKIEAKDWIYTSFAPR